MNLCDLFRFTHGSLEVVGFFLQQLYKLLNMVNRFHPQLAWG